MFKRLNFLQNSCLVKVFNLLYFIKKMKKKHDFLNPDCSNNCSKSCSKVFSKRPFVPAVLRTASTHYILRVPENAPSKKVAKRQLSHSLIPLHFVPLHSFIRSQTFFAYTRKLARWPLCKRCKEQCKHSQPSRFVHLLRSSTTLCGLPVSAGGPVSIRVHFSSSANIAF